MSNWTHVAGIIRIDDFNRCTGGKPLNFEALIDLPWGSEGFLNMEVWENPDKSSMAGYTVSIFGDLRDHDSADEIIDWFKETCAKFIEVRQAVITVRNERFGVKNFFCDYVKEIEKDVRRN